MATDRATVVLLAVMSMVLVAGFVTLAVLGVDTTAYVVFLSGPLLTTIVGAVLSHKVAAVKQIVGYVQEQTNGIAAAQSARLDAHLTAQDDTARESARAASELGQRLTQRPPGPPQSNGPTAA